MLSLPTCRPVGMPLFFVLLLVVLPALGSQRYKSSLGRILSKRDTLSRTSPLVATVNDNPITGDRRVTSTALVDLFHELVKRGTVDVDPSAWSSSTSSISSDWWSGTSRSFSDEDQLFHADAVHPKIGGEDDHLFDGRARAAHTRTSGRIWEDFLRSRNRGNAVTYGTNMAPATKKYISYTNASYGICGNQPLPPPFVHRIVSGSNALDRWPWQVNIVNATTGETFCGGTLITNEHVLTAAHCFAGKDRHDIILRLGDHSRLSWERTEQNFSIDCLHVHRRFNLSSYRRDIALVKLATDPDHRVVINEHVSPACLPDPGEFEAGKTCYITGWGHTSFVNLYLGIRPDIIQEAQVPLLSNRECKNAYGTRIHSKMVCAGAKPGGNQADTCKGDSGGPLVCRSGSDGPFKLWGITSWGDNYFCNPRPTTWVPGVYTRVEKYLRWIQRKLRSTQCW